MCCRHNRFYNRVVKTVGNGSGVNERIACSVFDITFRTKDRFCIAVFFCVQVLHIFLSPLGDVLSVIARRWTGLS